MLKTGTAGIIAFNYAMRFAILILLLFACAAEAAEIAPGIQWQRTFGGSNHEWLYALQATPDGGCVLGGSSQSGVSGNKTSTNYGGPGEKICAISDGKRLQAFAVAPRKEKGGVLVTAERDGLRVQTMNNAGKRSAKKVEVQFSVSTA